jgi:hypothetical protein
MSNTIFSPKGGWHRTQLTLFMAEVNKPKSLVNPTRSTNGHWKPEMFTVPCTKKKEKGCGVCTALEDK